MNLKNINQKYIAIYRLVWSILIWIPLIIMIILSLSQLSFLLFSTFTFQSNLFVALWLTLNLISYKWNLNLKILKPAIHGAITLYISVTFIIFAIILAPGYVPEGIYIFTNLMVHYIVPIAMIIEWILTETDVEYKWSYELYWMIYPIGYLVYSLILGGVFSIYIYPFFDVTKLGVPGLIFVIIGLTSFILLLGCLYIIINRKILHKPKKS